MPTRYEEVLGSASGRAARLGSRFAGAAAHRSEPTDDPRHRAIRDVAAGVAAPMLVAYVFWILRDAEARGLQRLYFLSRDGQVLLDIARRLALRCNLDLELRYLFASRLAWNRALSEPEVQGWLWDDLPPRATVADFLARLGLSEAEGRAAIAAAGGTVPHGVLAAGDIEDLRTLFGDPVFLSNVAEVRRRHRALLEAYVDQEGLGEPVAKAIVDIGWIGTLHETLSHLLVGRGVDPPHGYFFGLKSYDTPWKPYRHAFCFDANADGPVDMLLPGIDLFVVSEVFCAADHGTVTGFRRDGARVVAELATGWADRVDAWGLPVLRAAIAGVADRVDLDGTTAEDALALRTTVGVLMRRFWMNPTRDEARAWSAFPWDGGQGAERVVQHLAEPYGLVDIPGLVRNRRLRKRHVFWMRGALALSPPLARWSVRFFRILEELARRCTRRYVRRGRR